MHRSPCKKIQHQALPFVFLLGCCGPLAAYGQAEAAVLEDATLAATTPAHRLDTEWWKRRHAEKLKAPERTRAEIVFIGDSITQGFEIGKGKAIWNKRLAPRKAFNLGFSGDRTEHVLWRLDHGELDGIAPRLFVVMIGTNNTGQRMDDPEHIAAGVRAICERLQTKAPEARILLLAIFPRGAEPGDKMRINNTRANKLIASLADGDRIRFVDIGSAFLTPDGRLSREIMPDLLHPNAQGYRIWANRLARLLDAMLATASRG